MNGFHFAYVALSRQTGGWQAGSAVAKSEDIVLVISDAIMVTHDRQGNRHKDYSAVAKSSSSAQVSFNAIQSGCYGRAWRFFICIIRWTHRAISAASRIMDARHRPTIHQTTTNWRHSVNHEPWTKPSPNPNVHYMRHSAWPTRIRTKMSPSHKVRHRRRTVCLPFFLTLLSLFTFLPHRLQIGRQG